MRFVLHLGGLYWPHPPPFFHYYADSTILFGIILFFFIYIDTPGPIFFFSVIIALLKEEEKTLPNDLLLCCWRGYIIKCIQFKEEDEIMIIIIICTTAFQHSGLVIYIYRIIYIYRGHQGGDIIISSSATVWLWRPFDGGRSSSWWWTWTESDQRPSRPRPGRLNKVAQQWRHDI